jgi:hypothetical protein
VFLRQARTTDPPILLALPIEIGDPGHARFGAPPAPDLAATFSTR